MFQNRASALRPAGLVIVLGDTVVEQSDGEDTVEKLENDDFPLALLTIAEMRGARHASPGKSGRWARSIIPTW